MKNITRFLPLIFIIVLLTILTLRLFSDVNPETVQTPQIGRTAPSLSLPVYKTQTQKNIAAAQNGKPVLVNFFASWCAPCHVEHEILMKLSEQKSWRIIGVVYKDTPEAITAYLKKLGNPYDLILIDSQGKLGLEIGLTGVPETFGIDRNHVIRTHLAGPFADLDQFKPLLFDELHE